MKRAAAILMSTVCLVVLVGCKSGGQSRVYEADVETTWAAAIRVVEDLTSAPPAVANEEEKRIVTEWTPLSDGGGQGSMGMTSSREMARGTLQFTQVESGTEVTIRVDRQTREVEESVGRNTQTGTVGIVLGGSSGGLEQLFLDRLTEELEKDDAPEEESEGEVS
jgi:hypothetical protein